VERKEAEFHHFEATVLARDNLESSGCFPNQSVEDFFLSFEKSAQIREVAGSI
jgi:hypothetical protein